MNTAYVCKCCKIQADAKEQMALMVGRPANTLVTCWTPGCHNFGLTKDTRDTAYINAMFMVFASASSK